MALDLTSAENQAELAKLIQSEGDKVRTKYSLEQKGLQDQLSALQLAGMTNEAKATFESEQRTKALETRELALATKEMDLGTKELLVTKGLKPELSALLTANTMEGRTAQLEVLVKAMNLQVTEKVADTIGANDPLQSNISTDKVKTMDFKNMTYAQRVELYQKDQKLYATLSSAK